MLNLVDPQIEHYCLSKSSSSPALCDELETYTKNHVEMPEMLVGKLVASFLGFLVRSQDARRVLEIGTYTGYSALAMASELPDSGELLTLDISPKTTAIAQKFWNQSEDGKKIKSLIGPAMQILPTLNAPFELIFIDADKKNYLNYLKMGLELIADRGVIVLDNCLWGGKVLASGNGDEATQGIKEVNDFARNNAKLYSTLLPIRDGLLLIQKK